MRQRSNAAHASFARLPFNFCAVSLQPFNTPVCTSEGTIFDHENILRWLKDHGTNPINGANLKLSDLINLEFVKNESGEYVDPVTFKVFTDNTHIVAIRHGATANVFAYDTVERLNVKAKIWRDLVNDEEFGRKDMITLQDPQNLDSRDLKSFKFIKDGEDPVSQKEEASINTSAMGSSAKIMKAKEAVTRARIERENAASKSSSAPKTANGAVTSTLSRTNAEPVKKPAPKPYNASHHTTGQAAASFTSTGLTPHTSTALALLTSEEYLLKPRRVKHPSYARLRTTHGTLNLELYPEHAPKAVWNFIQLAKRGYYDGIPFHRNIKGFMIQGGDPTGTGRGGQSCWGNKTFEDELDGPLKHDRRGTMSMANKGKNTNSSQFFILYGKAPHLDRKHTIFGRIVGGMDKLDVLEKVEVDGSDRPKEKCEIVDISVFVDSFEEFWKKKVEEEEKGGGEQNKQSERNGEGKEEDERTTWTGKRIRGNGTQGDADDVGGVGKYLKAAQTGGGGDDVSQGRSGMHLTTEEPLRKKAKGFGGFGNFDSW